MATFARGYWLTRTQAHNQRIQLSITRQTVSTAHGKITWIITAGDEITLRGIPAIGRGVAGAITGTNPEGAATR